MPFRPKLNSMTGGRTGPFQRPPGFPHGGGRGTRPVDDRGTTSGGAIPGGATPQGTPQPPIPNEGNQAPTGQQPPTSFGGDMPWLQAWEGPFAAPMSPWEQQGLEGISDFAANDFGLGDAQDYLSRVFGGEFLSGNEPNFQAIEDSGRVLQEMQDDRALRELQSRAAAGGNALSGALMGQEQDYLRGSNAAFNNMMAQLRAANYGRERGFQQDAVRASQGLSDQRLGGFGALMGAGAVPRSIADQELRGQYGDFLRQGQDFEDAFRYPDELALATGRMGYPGSHPVLFGDSDAEGMSALLSQIFGGGGLGSGIMDFFNGLLGGNQQQDPNVSGDGVGYDGEEGPSSYKDEDFYNRALTESQNQAKAKQENAGKASGPGKAMMIMALLAQVLGIGKNQQQGGRRPGAGGGGGNSVGGNIGEAARKGLDALFNKNPYKSDPKLAAAWAKEFTNSGKPRDKAEEAGYVNDLSDIQKIGGSMDDPSSPYFGDPLFDPNNFAGGDLDDPSSPYFDDPLFDPDNFANGSSFDDPGTPYFNDPLFNPDNFGNGTGMDDSWFDPGMPDVEYI